MLETRPVFIGSREALGRWHPHRCHKGDTWAKETSHAKSLLDESDGSRNLGERKWGQMCKRCKKCKRCGRHEGCGKCECYHTCVSTHLG